MIYFSKGKISEGMKCYKRMDKSYMIHIFNHPALIVTDQCVNYVIYCQSCVIVPDIKCVNFAM